jgi:hypothetical protein
MFSLNFFIILLIIVVIFSSTVSCSTYRPATELLYNGMYPYSVEGFSNVNENAGNEEFTYVKGFNGLMTQPGSSSSIGGIHGFKGNSTCKSYGYTNSQGNVCLDDNHIELLSTRGGNCDKI